MNKLLSLSVVVALFMLLSISGKAQNKRTALYSLDDVIKMAHERSLSALIAKHNFRANYWEFRSYKADLLPKLNLNADLGNFNRSLTPLQNSETGEIKYLENYNLSNSVNLSIDQNITFTGGTISLYSSLERLDQFSPSRSVTYYTQPISLSYIQPIGGFNRFKWEKKTQPKKYEYSKRKYVEAMEDVTITAVQYFFDLILEQQTLDAARKNYENTQTLYAIAQERYKIGSVQKNDLLQLELRMINDGMTINNSELQYEKKRFMLKSFIGLTEDVNIVLTIPDNILDITMDYENVMSLWERNSSFSLGNDIKLLEAQMSVAEARGQQGVKVALNARFGLTQTDKQLSGAYANPIDQEVLGLRLTVPILDWGMSKGRVQMAQSRQEVVETQILQDQIDKRQDIYIKVLQFNNQHRQCKTSSKADAIANERYNIVMERFKNGTISVTDMNQAQVEKDAAVATYVDELRNYWYYYFNIRRLALYDYISKTDIITEIDELVEK